jgi:hypothetical protein
VWIQNPLAARCVDVADALYTFMLRVLVQVFTLEGRTPPSKRALLETSLDVMHAMTSVAEAATYFSANDDTPAVRAGLSFAMGGVSLRSTAMRSRRSSLNVFCRSQKDSTSCSQSCGKAATRV